MIVFSFISCQLLFFVQNWILSWSRKGDCHYSVQCCSRGPLHLSRQSNKCFPRQVKSYCITMYNYLRCWTAQCISYKCNKIVTMEINYQCKLFVWQNLRSVRSSMKWRLMDLQVLRIMHFSSASANALLQCFMSGKPGYKIMMTWHLYLRDRVICSATLTEIFSLLSWLKHKMTLCTAWFQRQVELRQPRLDLLILFIYF